MRHLKAFGLLAMAVAALLALAASASAGTTITSPTGTVATPTIKAESEGGHITLSNPIANISCSSILEAKIESHGAEAPARGKVTSLTFACTNSWHATTVALGELVVHWTSGYNGIVTSTGTKVSTTRLGVPCIYETINTQVGTITGGTPATIHLAASIPINATESSGLCGTGNSKLEGSLKLTSPESLFVDEGIFPGTTITSPTGTVATPTLKAETEGGHFTLANPIANINCASAFEGKVESHGAEVAAIAKLSSLSFTGCTNSWHLTTVTPGELAIEWSSGYNGVVTSTGMKFDTTRLGITCVYETSATKLGAITGGSPATLHLEASITISSKESSGLCGSGTAKWTGSLKLTSPESLFVDEGIFPGTTITSPTGTVATPTLKAETEGGHFTLANPIANINCASAFEGKVESHGAESAASGKLSSLSFTGCTNSWHVTTVTPGEFMTEWTSGYNGTISSTGMKFDTTRLGITCVYETSATKLGAITGGTPATVHLEASIPLNAKESNGLCGTESSKLEGNYKLTTPESLFVDEA